MPAAKILGTGRYVPPKIVTNFDVMKMMETSNEFIVERTGVLRRRHAEPDQSASDLAVPACQAAVANAGLTMDQIDLVIMNTITPDCADPGCAFFLQAKLGLNGVPVLDIRQQCAGLIYGLAVADQFVRTGKFRHVLVACSEVLQADRRLLRRTHIAILLGDGWAVVRVYGGRPPGIISTTPMPTARAKRVTRSPGKPLTQGTHHQGGHRRGPRPLPHGRQGRVRKRRGQDVRGLPGGRSQRPDHGPGRCAGASSGQLRMLEAIRRRLASSEKTFVNVEEHEHCVRLAPDCWTKPGKPAPAAASWLWWLWIWLCLGRGLKRM